MNRTHCLSLTLWKKVWDSRTHKSVGFTHSQKKEEDTTLQAYKILYITERFDNTKSIIVITLILYSDRYTQ
jgi:hypothetical protein